MFLSKGAMGDSMSPNNINIPECSLARGLWGTACPPTT